MSYPWIISLLMIISICSSVHGSYHYVGCYTQVFYDSFFKSSFMEPTLCFRLCDTPIVYLQKTICRCSGGGLMHRNQLDEKYCTISCAKPFGRLVQIDNKCGGTRTYSAYVEEQFYIRHGHLFTYQIQFLSCELWKKHDVYDTLSVTLDDSSIQSSLNTMEQCAATCLDLNVTTKSIAFNGNKNKCLCILPWKSSTVFQRSHYIEILSNNSCNRYCNNTSDDSKVENKFQCGSLKDPQIWAIYDLNGTCPSEFIYIKELKKCMYTYEYEWRSCPPLSQSYTYDGSVQWKIFLKIIERLKLNNSTVIIDVDEDIVIDSSLKCPPLTTTTTTTSTRLYSYLSHSRSYGDSYMVISNTRYVLKNGCLSETLYASYLHRYANRLCITDPINKYSSSYDDRDNSNYLTDIDSTIKYCPAEWFDLNERCYRMSNERKTIQDARNNCITISKIESNKNDKSYFWSYDNEDVFDDEEQLNDSPKGEIVQYASQWQARLGFFLLDAILKTDVVDTESSTRPSNEYYEDLSPLPSIDITDLSSVIQFQMISSTENNNSSMTDNSCVISSRKIVEEEERPILQNIQINNCSKARYALCETKTLIVQNFQQGCFRKPLTLDLPALISNRLTYELCVSVCRELQTKLVVIHINKCYCINDFTSKIFNLTAELKKYQQNNCGNPCSGNRHEQCGNEDTIIIFYILDSQRTYRVPRVPSEPFPDFKYDSCLRVNFFNPSTTYQFKLNNINNVHPRYCLELCTNYQQKYAFINSNTCFCTNIPIKNKQYNITILSNQHCSQQCAANYFYTCGNNNNSTVYSMYIMQPKCRHGFEVAENDQQCVYSHLSTKKKSFSIAQSYCNSIGGVIAKINDILELQDILPESILHSRLISSLSGSVRSILLTDIRYYWIDRTLNIPDNNTISDRLLGKCFQTSKISDRNCIDIHHEKKSFNNRTTYEHCITESDQCSLRSAIPVCVDQHLEVNRTYIPSLIDHSSLNLSINVSIDYSCGDDTEYHFVDNYCYKISYHEVSWNEAKSECERDNAMLFVPEKSITLQIIKSLFLHRSSYTESGFAHVGVIYDNQNRTVIQYNTTAEGTLRIVPDSNTVYDLCEKTFHEHYTKLMSSTSLSKNERNKIQNQQMGCAYIDLLSNIVPIIRCDQIPCNRIATVICQKSPILKTDIVTVKREDIEISTAVDTSLVSVDDPTPTTTSNINFSEYTKSVGRDFAPIFFILAILFALIFLGFLSTIYNHHLFQKKTIAGRRTLNSVYSQLTSADELD